MASNIEVASYDPKKVNLVLNGKIITGFASDSMITIARNEEDRIRVHHQQVPVSSCHHDVHHHHLSGDRFYE